jgi:hypothetical protein
LASEEGSARDWVLDSLGMVARASRLAVVESGRAWIMMVSPLAVFFSPHY